VYVYRRGENPVRVFRIDLATGKRTLWKQISPPTRPESRAWRL
jgi:hypothetical protein